MSLEFLIILTSAVLLAVIIISIAALWKIFEKAGRPGWNSIIPFYGTYVLFEIVGRPGLWLILVFIPIVNFIVLIIAFVDLAKVFGKSGWFAVGIIFLPFIFYPILGFGDAEYNDPNLVSL